MPAMLNTVAPAAQLAFVSASSAWMNAGPMDPNRSKAFWTSGASRCLRSSSQRDNGVMASVLSAPTVAPSPASACCLLRSLSVTVSDQTPSMSSMAPAPNPCRSPRVPFGR